MKEYLSKDYCVQKVSDINTLCEIPEGAEVLTVKKGKHFVFWKSGFKKCVGHDLDWVKTQFTADDYMKEHKDKGAVIAWRRADILIDDSVVDAEYLPEKKHSHYFKDVSNLLELDVYRVLKLFDVTDPCIQHAVKKLLCAGGRGVKDVDKDVHEAIDSLLRYEEMRKEDENE